MSPKASDSVRLEAAIVTDAEKCRCERARPPEAVKARWLEHGNARALLRGRNAGNRAATNVLALRDVRDVQRAACSISEVERQRYASREKSFAGKK